MTEQAAGRARWTVLAALGLGLVALAPALMLIAGLLWGLSVGEQAGFFVVLIVVPGLASLLGLRFGTWAKVVGAIVSLLVAGALYWTAFGLGSPTSFFDFMVGVLVLPGALVGLVSSIAAIVAGRRGHRSPTPVGGERTAIGVALAIVLVAAGASAATTLASRSSADEARADATLRQFDFEFTPADLSLTGGARVLVRNDDPFLHTFTVDALGIDASLTPGSEELVEIPARPGEYVFYCRPHTGDKEDPGEDDMAGRLRVT